MAQVTARTLTKAGFTPDPARDFHDDGTNFKGFIYEEMPLSYAKHQDDVYISIRVDYLGEFNYEEYSTMPSYQLADEFNGVPQSEVDTEKIKENIKAIKADIAKLRETLSKAKIDVPGIVRAMKDEQNEIFDLLAQLAEAEWYTKDEWALRRVADFAKKLKQTQSLDITPEFIESASPKTQRAFQYKLDNGKDLLNPNARGSYGDEIREFINGK